MTQQPPIDRAETARANDDSELIDRAADQGDAGTAHRTGGRTATDVGTRDELRQELDPASGITRATGKDEVQPKTPTRADNEGANG